MRLSLTGTRLARPFLVALGAVALAFALKVGGPAAADSGDRAEEREQMVARQIAGRDIRDPRVLRAMREVPRHRFVPEPWTARAYDDTPLPIGVEETISQPYIVAKMTELAAIGSDDVVFELGTGSGYQAAVASRLAKHVYTIEINAELAERAKHLLAALGYENISVRAGDGLAGWPEKAPFAVILATAAIPEVPKDLVRQLAPGGRMILPLGAAGGVQDLVLIRKGEDGEATSRTIFPVRFIPVRRPAPIRAPAP